MASLPLTYPDLICGFDLDPYGRETTSDFENLVQDILHVLLELPGSNPDDPTRGIGVHTYLNGTLDAFNSLPGKIEEQLSRDDRVNTVSASIAPQSDGTFKVNLRVSVGESVIPLEYGWENGNFTRLA
jgi:hypothetical protein